MYPSNKAIPYNALWSKNHQWYHIEYNCLLELSSCFVSVLDGKEWSSCGVAREDVAKNKSTQSLT